jgi:predicted nucleotidyltransferase
MRSSASAAERLRSFVPRRAWHLVALTKIRPTCVGQSGTPCLASPAGVISTRDGEWWLTIVIALVEQNRDALARLCRQFRVERLELFGSAAKGDFQADSSDVDFLVTFADARPGTYADRYLGLLLALEHLFQREIDLVTERSIRNPYFRKAVEATRQLVYDGRGEEAAA